MALAAAKKSRVERYGPGESIEVTKPGDFILTHREELYSRVVSFGQRMRFTGEDRKYAHWSHAALVAGYKGELIEAVGEGVVSRTLAEYHDVEYHYVRTGMSLTDRRQAVKFAESCLEQKYAWASIAALAIVLLTNTRFEFGLERTQFCSDLVARSLERGPFIFPKSPSMMMPAHLAQFFHVIHVTSE